MTMSGSGTKSIDLSPRSYGTEFRITRMALSRAWCLSFERITVHVTGSVASPEITYSSESGYPREAVERMLLGLSPYPDEQGDNTALANSLAAEAVAAGLVPGLGNAGPPRREVRYGEQRSRIDLLYAPPAGPPVWVEVKNVSLVENGHGRFPDAPTERGRKHLGELEMMAAAGDRADGAGVLRRGEAAPGRGRVRRRPRTTAA